MLRNVSTGGLAEGVPMLVAKIPAALCVLMMTLLPGTPLLMITFPPELLWNPIPDTPLAGFMGTNSELTLRILIIEGSKSTPLLTPADWLPCAVAVFPLTVTGVGPAIKVAA